MPFPRTLWSLALGAALVAGLGWAVADDAPPAGRDAAPASPQEKVMPAANPPAPKALAPTTQAPTAQAPGPRATPATPATPAAKVVLRTATFAAG